MPQRKKVRAWLVCVCDLDEPTDRVISHHATEAEARAKARSLNRAIAGDTGVLPLGVVVPLFYAMRRPSGKSYRRLATIEMEG